MSDAVSTAEVPSESESSYQLHVNIWKKVPANDPTEF
jgi:hypothetical protein